MLYIQEESTLIEEVRQAGIGNGIAVEIFKFLIVATFGNIVALLTNKAIKYIVFAGKIINQDVSMINQLLGNFFGIILVILLCLGVEKRTALSLALKKEHICKQYLKGMFVGVIMISSIVLIGICFRIFIFHKNDIEINILIMLLFFFGFMLQGFYEEIIFRSYFMLSIIRKYNIVVAVSVNSFFFGLVHIANNGFQIIAFLNLILFGIFESMYLLKTGSLLGTSAIHGIWNFAQGNFYGFNVSGIKVSQSLFTLKTRNLEIFTGGDFGLEGSMLSTAILIIAIMMIMRNKTEKLREV